MGYLHGINNAIKVMLFDVIKLANTIINNECSAILLNKVPEKLGDLKKFLIPCALQDLEVCQSLADSGVSINLLPLSIYEKLEMGRLKPTKMTLELANRSVAHLVGIAQDVIVRVDKLNFLVDFVVVDFEADSRVPIILGRPFLRYKGSFHSINIIDFTKDEQMSGSPTPFLDPVITSPSSSITPFEDIASILEETDAFLDLDDPPDIEDGFYDSEGDILFLKNYLMKIKSLVSLLKLTQLSMKSPPRLIPFYHFPSKMRTRFSTPGILILERTQFFNDLPKDKNFKVNSSSEALLILEDKTLLSQFSDHELSLYPEFTMIASLLSFLSKNKDKFSIPVYSLLPEIVLSL
ncbi:reverse transcriptase domain-containing protein [Tanacetum coccineum]